MKKFFLHSGTTHFGPFSLDDLKSKGISKQDLVWFEGATDWQKAEDIEDLQQLFNSIPPPLNPKYILQSQERFTKADLGNLSIEGIKKDPQFISDITTLLVSANENFAESFNIQVQSFKFSENVKNYNQEWNAFKENVKAYIEDIKRQRAVEIENIRANRIKYLDETIAYLCLSNQRNSAVELYSQISKEDATPSSVYVENIIAKYSIDMSLEKQSLQNQKEHEERMIIKQEESEKTEKAKEESKRYRITNLLGVVGFIGCAIIYYMTKEAKEAGRLYEMEKYTTLGYVCFGLLIVSVAHPLYVKYIDKK